MAILLDIMLTYLIFFDTKFRLQILVCGTIIGTYCHNWYIYNWILVCTKRWNEQKVVKTMELLHFIFELYVYHKRSLGSDMICIRFYLSLKFATSDYLGCLKHYGFCSRYVSSPFLVSRILNVPGFKALNRLVTAIIRILSFLSVVFSSIADRLKLILLKHQKE